MCKKTFYVIINLVFLSTLTSCNKMYGFGDLEKISNEKIKNGAAEFSIENVYEINPNKFLKLVSELKDKDSTAYHELSQPLIISWFDGNNVSFYFANCHAGGFPKLNWNSQHHFDNCELPRFISSDEISTVILQDSLFLNLETKEYVKPNQSTMIVFWNFFIKKQSKFLIDFAKEYSRNCDSKRVMFVNNDNYLFKIYNL